MNRILHVVGARPNFMKIAPIMREMHRCPDQFDQLLVHTGQHYDETMSKVFFEELELPHPDVNLEVGSGTHAWQTAQIMQRFEPVILDYRPDWVLVPGDVNSTLACALVAAKLGVPVAHLEAGLRSFDRTMPEEINRIVADHLSDILFTTEPSANQNLVREGISTEKLHYVGNVMIDTLCLLLPKAQERWQALQAKLKLDRFVLVTLHRPTNVDQAETLIEILSALEEMGQEVQIIFPVHPRTRARLSQLEPAISKTTNIQLLEPLGYLDFLALQAHAALVLTDSGGVQEETTYLGIPCLTARPNTERPVTITTGTNRLVESKKSVLVQEIQSLLMEGCPRPSDNRHLPPLWDGKAAVRVAKVLLDS